MKVILKLTILVAALLLVTNMAFAGCDNQLICYDILATEQNGDTNSDLWEVCLNDDGTGSLYSNNTQTSYGLYLFGGGPGWFNTSGYPGFVNGKPKWATWIARGEYEAGFLQPIGEGGGGGDLLTGEGVRETTRYTIQGKKVPCISCSPGLQRCGQQCVDLMTDENNCGACGNVCSPGYFCSSGSCIGT